MTTELPNYPRFFERDPDHQDLGCGELATRRYLRLVNSADYRPNPLMSVSGDRRSEDLPLPPNLLTEGRRLTPGIKLKILGALKICSLPSSCQIRVYQLFHLTKFFGWRYNYKLNRWEEREL